VEPEATEESVEPEAPEAAPEAPELGLSEEVFTEEAPAAPAEDSTVDEPAPEATDA